MTNEERIRQALDRIQQERTALLSHIEGLSQAQLNFKPSRDSWSAGEVAHHVGLTEKLLQDNVKELLRTGGEKQKVTRKIRFDELPMGPRIIPNSLLHLSPVLIPFSIMNTFMPRALQSFILANPIIKIRTAPIVEPKAGIPRDELMAYLNQLRESTLKLLEPVKSRDLSRLRWNHPLMGTYDVYGTLELLANHDRRHQMQMERIKRSPNFPAS